APPPRRRSSGATAPPSWSPGPRSCSRCGTSRPSRRAPARPTGSSSGPGRAEGCGAICCCSASTPGGHRPADRTPTGRPPWRSGDTSGASWTTLRPPPTPRSRPRCSGWASASVGAAAPGASCSTPRAGRGATCCQCPTARHVVERTLQGGTGVTAVVALYDERPWLDIENRVTKRATLDKEALYVAFPFALTKPTVEVEVALGRMTVERDQQPGSCRDWYCHAHWVWLHDAAGGMLWSGPDTPLFTLNDIFRGQWRRKMEPDGTLFADGLHNYWPTNFAPSQGGGPSFRYRLSALARGGERAETGPRGGAACDPLYVSAPDASVGSGALPRK